MRSRFFILLFFPLASLAQNNAVKLDLVAPSMANVYKVSFERNLGRFISGNIAFEGGKYSTQGASINIDQSEPRLKVAYKVSGAGVTPELRVYPLGTAPGGLFAGVYTRVRKYQEHFTESDQIFNGTGINSGLNVGYKYVIGKRLSLEAMMGYGSAWGSYKRNQPKDATKYRKGYDGLNNHWRFEFNVGILFPKFQKELSVKDNGQIY